jgi:hypothetical protein
VTPEGKLSITDCNICVISADATGAAVRADSTLGDMVENLLPGRKSFGGVFWFALSKRMNALSHDPPPKFL